MVGECEVYEEERDVKEEMRKIYMNMKGRSLIHWVMAKKRSLSQKMVGGSHRRRDAEGDMICE